MLPFVHFLPAVSHVMWAFSQAAWVVGDFVEANAAPVKATARPSATIVVTRLFILLLLLGAFR
jgi:hypothetical protein